MPIDWSDEDDDDDDTPAATDNDDGTESGVEGDAEPGLTGFAANGKCTNDAAAKQSGDVVDGPGSSSSNVASAGKKRGRKPREETAEGGAEEASAKKAESKRTKQESKIESKQVGADEAQAAVSV